VSSVTCSLQSAWRVTVGQVQRRNMSADIVFMLGLLDLMPPTICCVRSKSVRDFVTEISGGARRHRCGVAQSSSSELATQAPAQPATYIVASGCPCGMWTVVWLLAAHPHTHPWADFGPHPASRARLGYFVFESLVLSYPVVCFTHTVLYLPERET
jgi:hypothetical protein